MCLETYTKNPLSDESGNWFFGLYVKGCVRYIFASLFAKESTNETRKNAFYFTLKALFVLEIIKF